MDNEITCVSLIIRGLQDNWAHFAYLSHNLYLGDGARTVVYTVSYDLSRVSTDSSA